MLSVHNTLGSSTRRPERNRKEEEERERRGGRERRGVLGVSSRAVNGSSFPVELFEFTG